ncbi:MAG: hypothetical protein HY401_03345 [Elusimicrobia bacterium]|nr:hypothetical protein [Elusimicrobiota bacterium]
MENEYLKIWKALENPETQPRRARGIIEVDYAEFERKVLEQDPNFVKSLVESLYSGDAYLLREAFPKKFMMDLREWVHRYWNTTPSSFHKMIEGCPNFHRLIDEQLSKNYSFRNVRRSAYFFPWNHDPLNLYGTIGERWGICKFLGGFALDEYQRNTPKDGVVDRAQVALYPLGGGCSEPHSDPYLNQRVLISCYMSKRGQDYKVGGFQLTDKAGEIVDFESRVNIGDMGIAYATVLHEVAPVDPHEKINWNSNEGRWFLGLYSVDSDMVKNRHTGYAVKA